MSASQSAAALRFTIRRIASDCSVGTRPGYAGPCCHALAHAYRTGPFGYLRGHAVRQVFARTPLLTVTVERRGDGDIHLHARGQGFWMADAVILAKSYASVAALQPLCAAPGLDLPF